MANRYYWLKLNKNFFKTKEIMLIENMANGKDYIIFYMKILLESIETDGQLRFNDILPYNPEMLGIITCTNVDVVKAAIKLFQDLNMIDVWDDETIYMTRVNEMLGSESDSAQRVRKHREKCNNIPELPLHCNINVTTGNKNVTQSKSKSKIKSLDKDIDKNIEREGEKEIIEKSKPKNPAPAKNNSDLSVDKELFGDFVYLSGIEYQRLMNDLGTKLTLEYIERLNDYIGQIGVVAAKKKYVSHFHVIKNWFRRDSGTQSKSKPSNTNGLAIIDKLIMEAEKDEF